MIKDFTTYQQALKLKELGFDEPCVSFFQTEYNEITPIMVDDDYQYRLTGMRTCKNSEIPEHYTASPTFSQAFRFFREKYRLSVLIHDCLDDYIGEIIEWTITEDKIIHEVPNRIKTYEEAELHCLNKLITLIF